MTKEQEQAIEIINKMLKSYIEADECRLTNDGFKHEIRAMQTVLNMLKEKDKEIEQLQKENDILKNHIHYKKCRKCGKEFRAKRSDARYCKECRKTINNKEWYRNLTEKQKEKRREQAKISMRKLRERRKNDIKI